MTNTVELDPVACAAFLVVSFVLAGCCQAVWLASAMSRRLAWPLDFGRTIQGRRIFGANKTVRGFVVMVPATSLAFMVAALAMPAGRAVWPLTPLGYAALGLAAGAGFMLGELPNSFLKRRIGIAPGAAARGSLAPLFLLLDRVDSAVGLLAAISLVVPVPLWTAIYVLTVGPLLHGLFSVLTFQLGGKARAA
jgi:hypothetical protein